MATIHRAPRPNKVPAEKAEAKRFHFPSAFTVLFGVTLAVWLLAFIVPPAPTTPIPRPADPSRAATRRPTTRCRSATA